MSTPPDPGLEAEETHTSTISWRSVGKKVARGPLPGTKYLHQTDIYAGGVANSLCAFSSERVLYQKLEATQFFCARHMRIGQRRPVRIQTRLFTKGDSFVKTENIHVECCQNMDTRRRGRKREEKVRRPESGSGSGRRKGGRGANYDSSDAELDRMLSERIEETRHGRREGVRRQGPESGTRRGRADYDAELDRLLSERIEETKRELEREKQRYEELKEQYVQERMREFDDRESEPGYVNHIRLRDQRVGHLVTKRQDGDELVNVMYKAVGRDDPGEMEGLVPDWLSPEDARRYGDGYNPHHGHEHDFDDEEEDDDDEDYYYHHHHRHNEREHHRFRNYRPHHDDHLGYDRLSGQWAHVPHTPGPGSYERLRPDP